MKNIMIGTLAVLKFNERSNLLNNSDLFRKAVISQAHLNKHSSNSLTNICSNQQSLERATVVYIDSNTQRLNILLFKITLAA